MTILTAWTVARSKTPAMLGVLFGSLIKISYEGLRYLSVCFSSIIILSYTHAYYQHCCIPFTHIFYSSFLLMFVSISVFAVVFFLFLTVYAFRLLLYVHVYSLWEYCQVAFFSIKCDIRTSWHCPLVSSAWVLLNYADLICKWQLPILSSCSVVTLYWPGLKNLSWEYWLWGRNTHRVERQFQTEFWIEPGTPELFAVSLSCPTPY